MAFASPSQNIPDSELRELSRQIGSLLPGLPVHKKYETVGIGESFAIYEVKAKQFNSTPPTLPAIPTGYWHYQVFLDRDPLAYAVVYGSGGKLNIYEIAVSAVAERIHKAIERVDRYDKGDTPVRFLVVPSCLVYAFFLVDSGEVYVIDAPPLPTRVPEGGHLIPDMILSKEKFLDGLRVLHSALTGESESREKGRKGSSKGGRTDKS